MEYEIVMRDSLNCLQSTLASVAHTWMKNYYFMFIDAWDFNYKSDVIDENLVLCSGFNGAKKNMNKYHNIVTTKCSMQQLKNVLKENREEKCCGIIGVDTYFLPWSKFYKKAHYEHYVLVSYMSEVSVFCIDTYEYGKFGELKIRHNSEIDYYIVQEMNTQDMTPTFSNFVSEITSHVSNNIPFRRMMDFSKDLMAKNKDLNYLKNKDIDNNSVLYEIGELCRKRENLSFLCDEVYTIYKEEILLELRDGFKMCSQLWKKIQSLMALTIMTNVGEKYLMKTYVAIKEVAKIERKLCDSLKKCVIII